VKKLITSKATAFQVIESRQAPESLVCQNLQDETYALGLYRHARLCNKHWINFKKV